jgi:rhamnose utilization protein RhaD (predicted bifunctional aldolase and dehydrogenase)
LSLGLPAVKLDPLKKLRASLRRPMSMVVQRLNLLDSSAPNPSVETSLHAFLPHNPWITPTPPPCCRWSTAWRRGVGARGL